VSFLCGKELAIGLGVVDRVHHSGAIVKARLCDTEANAAICSCNC
jgi:hypothetical protein